MSEYTYHESTTVLATEFNLAAKADGNPVFKKGDGEKAPKFLALPTGEDAARVLYAGVLTEVRDVGDNQEYLQIRTVTADGEPIIAYAGQYDDEAKAAVKSLDAPTLVAIVGKPRSYQTEEGDFYVNVRPESIVEIDVETKEHISAEAAQGAIERADPDSRLGGAVHEAGLSAARSVLGMEADDAEEADEQTEDDIEQAASGEDAVEGLDPIDIAKAAGVTPKPAEIIAENYTDPEMVAVAAEEGTLDELKGVGPATAESVAENADAVRALA